MRAAESHCFLACKNRRGKARGPTEFAKSKKLARRGFTKGRTAAAAKARVRI